MFKNGKFQKKEKVGLTPEFYYTNHRYEFLHTFQHIKEKSINIYEFGVYGGVSAINLIEQATKYGLTINKFYGIDSFEGLPNSEVESYKDWFKGAYSAAELFDRNPDESKYYVQSLLTAKFPNISITLIKSWFNELQPSSSWLPADYVHVDCDIYTSTLDVWNFLYTNKLLKVGP